jgi:hypothetical protein
MAVTVFSPRRRQFMICRRADSPSARTRSAMRSNCCGVNSTSRMITAQMFHFLTGVNLNPTSTEVSFILLVTDVPGSAPVGRWIGPVLLFSKAL